MATEEEFLDELDLFGHDQSDSDIVDTVTTADTTEPVVPFSTENTSPHTGSEKPWSVPNPKIRPHAESNNRDDVPADHIVTKPKLPSQKVKQKPKPSRRKSINDKDKDKNEIKDPVRVGIPTNFDILCGQSRICASHTGNQRFQLVLENFAPRYDLATSKQEKMTMTKEVVANFHNSGGRFLKYKDGMWEEISTVAARDKVSHALRTKVASCKRQQQEGGKGVSPGGRRSSMPSGRSKSKHRRGGCRSSNSSISTSASDIVAISFDGNDDSAASTTLVVNDLMKAQREIFATLTTPPRSTTRRPTDDVDVDSDPCPLKRSQAVPFRRSSSYF